MTDTDQDPELVTFEMDKTPSRQDTLADMDVDLFSDTLYASSLDSTVADALREPPINIEAQQGSGVDETPTRDLSKTFGPSMFGQVISNPTEGKGSPKEIVRFDIQSTLGVGTYGEVFGARDNDLNRDVALKQFKGQPGEALIACHNEVRFVGRLEHPNVPPIYQVSQTQEGTPYIVMKQLEGQSLDKIIEKLRAGDQATHAQYPFTVRAALIIQLLRVVIKAHDAQVLHRDIKPENINIGPQGELYLLDWGVAEEFEIAKTQPMVCGTPLYLSPEQGRGEPLNPSSDLYSVGAVAYELFSLHQSAPQGVDRLQDLIDALKTHTPRGVDMVSHPSQSYVGSEYRLPIMKALNPDASQRYQTASEMLYDFERALEGTFDVICPRTFTKSLTTRLGKWLDRSLWNVLILFGALSVVFTFTFIGLWIVISWILS